MNKLARAIKTESGHAPPAISMGEGWRPSTLLTVLSEGRGSERAHFAKLIAELSQQATDALGADEALEVWNRLRPRNTKTKGPHDPAGDADALSIYDFAIAAGKPPDDAVADAVKFLRTARRHRITEESAIKKHVGRIVSRRDEIAIKRKTRGEVIKLRPAISAAPSPGHVAGAFELIGAATDLTPKMYARRLGVSHPTLINYFAGRTLPKVTTPEQIQFLCSDIETRMTKVSRVIELLGGISILQTPCRSVATPVPSPSAVAEAYIHLAAVFDLAAKRYAGRIGVSQSTMSNYLNGRTIPKAIAPAHIKFLLDDSHMRMGRLAQARAILSGAGAA